MPRGRAYYYTENKTHDLILFAKRGLSRAPFHLPVIALQLTVDSYFVPHFQRFAAAFIVASIEAL